MRPVVIILLLLFTSVNLLSQTIEQRKEACLYATLEVETGGYGCLVNKKENAWGVLQIRPIMIDEANRIAGYRKYKLVDRADSLKSVEIWETVMDYWNPNYYPTRAVCVWNAGETRYTNKVDPYLRKFIPHYKVKIKELCK